MEAKDQESSGAKSRTPSPALPCGVRLQIFLLTTAIDIVERRDGTVNRGLFSLIDRKTAANPDRPDAASVRSVDITVDASRGLWVRVFTPSVAADAFPLPVIVYFHGGGFALFSAASSNFEALCRRFCCELGAVVVSVTYRLAPEHRYPAAYEDGVAVLRYLDDTGLPDLTVPVDVSSCFIAGDSAGGNIVHHVAQRWTSTSSAPSKSLRLAGIVPFQPYFGGEERTESEVRLEGVAPVVNMRRSDWSWKVFLPVGADRNHPAAHVSGEAGPEPELSDAFPPVLLVVGGFDPLQDWQRRYAGMLRRKGKPVTVAEFPDAFHGFYVFPELVDAHNVMQDMKAFVESNRSKPTAS